MSRLLALLLLVLGNAAAFAPTLASRSMVAARAPAVSVRRRPHVREGAILSSPPALPSAPRQRAGVGAATRRRAADCTAHAPPAPARGALRQNSLARPRARAAPAPTRSPPPRRPALLPRADPLSSPAPTRSPPPLQMSRICDITGKRANNANRVTFSNHHNQRWQQVNLQTKRFFSPELNREVRLKVATSTLRTIRKLGLDETAKKYNVDLSKF